MKTMRCISLSLLLAGVLPVYGSHLPDPAMAEAALWASPAVQQARAELGAQALRSEGIRRGRAEWTAGVDAAQRRIDAPAAWQAEWGVSLSRPLRLPPRAMTDRQLADAQLAYAGASLGEALHESGRQLLALWFDWLNESGQTAIWRAQAELAERQYATVDARIRLGESPRSDRASAEAMLAHARLQLQQATLRVQQAASRLQARFPAVGLQLDGALPHPVPPAGEAAAHVDAVMAHNHERARALRLAQALRAEARQLAARRSPDPGLGVFYRNEAAGSEHLLGVNMTLTLPGAARRSDQQAAEGLAAAALEALGRLDHRLRTEAQADFELAVAQVEHWRQAERAADAQETAARSAARAYELGEGSLDQVLATRRLALEARQLAHQLQVAALAQNARLQLDAHRLWPLDLDDEAHAHP
ncbi:MAG: TolC family protein [Thiobacillus sp.]|nr:TolC family protein [Thiobacillus sp.]